MSGNGNEARPALHAWYLHKEAWESCRRCRLCRGRRQVVHGRGSPDSPPASVLMVGEAPGVSEDARGVPFIGPVGKLLDLGIERAYADGSWASYWIVNVVGCQPPQNRTPRADEIKACRPRLEEIRDIVRPSVIVLLGAVARQARAVFSSIPQVETFHPGHVRRRGGLESCEFTRLWRDLREAFHLAKKETPCRP